MTTIQELSDRHFDEFDMPELLAGIEAEWTLIKKHPVLYFTYAGEVNGHYVQVKVGSRGTEVVAEGHAYRHLNSGARCYLSNSTPEKLAEAIDIDVPGLAEQEKEELRQLIKRYNPADGYGSHRRYTKFAKQRRRIHAGLKKYPELQDAYDARMEETGWDK